METTTRGPLTLEIVRDPEPDAGNPREWDQLGKLGVWAEKLGGLDELKLRRGFEIEDVLESAEFDEETGEAVDEIEAIADYWRTLGATGPVYPLTVRLDWQPTLRIEEEPTLDDWRDAGGVIFATEETLKNTGAPREKIGEQLGGEIDEVNAYLSGEVYAYRIKDHRGEVVDSVWGFLHVEEFADPDDRYGGAVNAGLDALEYEAGEIERKLGEAVKMGLRGYAVTD